MISIPIRTWTYKGETIELYPNGIYSAFIVGHGYLKADTLRGLKSLITDTLKGAQ
ncbi:hypothetical protein UFOVP453_32 [uncultured Caudovirales phage]|uniref:Uncharacterized protein n=1 Tax=uncultured Caudovirales phage TaxID=2100421 RepID=A0A6J5MCQ9_9CAUD|nr:hypothetical protein UFOVP453_32 [uncultured Caudovirales phage]